MTQNEPPNRIQAIETRYNGYRFRSRLEARWAVFFDAVGIEYRYEPEGFDLGELGYYLPDFYLPRQNTWIEIKPLKKRHVKLWFYLAGKIRKSGWRHDIVSFLRESSWKDNRAYIGRHGYSGPFFVGCDHGCGHASPHAMSAHHCVEQDRNLTKGQTLEHCLDGIQKSDIVFAWIDSLDCYGTLAEIGYAKRSAEIWIGFHSDLDTKELWFVEKMASHACRAQTATEAFKSLASSSDIEIGWSDEEQKCMALSRRSSAWPRPNTILINGEPFQNQHMCFNFNGWAKPEMGELHIWDYDNSVRATVLDFSRYFPLTEPIRKQAFQKARSARFEHGETP